MLRSGRWCVKHGWDRGIRLPLRLILSSLVGNLNSLIEIIVSRKRLDCPLSPCYGCRACNMAKLTARLGIPIARNHVPLPAPVPDSYPASHSSARHRSLRHAARVRSHSTSTFLTPLRPRIPRLPPSRIRTSFQRQLRSTSSGNRRRTIFQPGLVPCGWRKLYKWKNRSEPISKLDASLGVLEQTYGDCGSRSYSASGLGRD